MTDRNTKRPDGAYVQGSDVEAVDGQVLIDGPGGIAIAMTPEAAEETGVMLLAASATAKMQDRRSSDEAASGD